MNNIGKFLVAVFVTALFSLEAGAQTAIDKSPAPNVGSDASTTQASSSGTPRNNRMKSKSLYSKDTTDSAGHPNSGVPEVH